MAQACYEEPYLPASYKLIPFDAVEVTSSHGRRGAEGEFPFGETTGYADTGRKIRRYTLQGKFVNNNHVISAAALIAACELPGPGPLVHPTRGVIASAACVSIKVTDKVESEQGITYLDMEFVEANNWPNGLSVVGQLLGVIVAPLITSSRANFRASYAPQEIQTYRQGAVVNAAQEQVANIATEYTLSTTTEAADDQRNRVIYELNTVVNIDSEAEDTEKADRALSLGMNAVSIGTRGTVKFDAFRRLANGAARSSSFLNPAGSAEDAVYNLVRTLSAAYMAEGAMESRSLTSSEIFQQADAIDAILESEMDYARQICNNDLFLRLSEFRGSVQARLYEKAYTSPGRTQFDFGGSTHPLRAAYAIYGDAKRHRDLEEVNVVSSKGRFGNPVTGIVR